MTKPSALTKTSPRFLNADFTPDTVETKTAANGVSYLRARGSITRKGKPAIVRTIKAEGRAMADIVGMLAAGKPVKLRGFYDRVIIGGEPKGEFFVAVGLPKSQAELRALKAAKQAAA